MFHPSRDNDLEGYEFAEKFAAAYIERHYTLPPPIVFQSPLEKYEASLEFLKEVIEHEKKRQQYRDEVEAAKTARPATETSVEDRIANLSLRPVRPGRPSPEELARRPRPPPEELARRRRIGQARALDSRDWELTRRAAELQFRMEDLETEYQRSFKFCVIWRKHSRCCRKLEEQGHPTIRRHGSNFRQRLSYLLIPAMKCVRITQADLNTDTELSD
ncbi:uncharacterized protein FIESC28_00212 [Fusarium coffeatum]|uniref:Uncharacterized protein n=1 Tax=Fusarium coffeatum TaxID=231269 RepID=A0A366SC99_9HYPO|nr:uncharacterized protein FIESC28_00212 [Fusarium coffeatum]RBR26944.1 hypothetical protein FIESC28_00212 [Fusarium coffeatum]